MKKIFFAATLITLSFVATPALAQASNLVCQGGFRKIQTYTSSIKCFKQSQGYATADIARKVAAKAALVERVNQNRGRSLCNSTHGPVKMRVIQKDGRWVYQRWFTCVIIF